MRRSITSFFAAALFGGFLLAQSLTIYTEIAPPNQELGPDGTLTGFTVDVVREIQKRVGNRDPIQVVPWVRGYKEIQSRANVVLFSMARSADRYPLFEWVGPLAESSYVFYVKADSKVVINNLEDAKKLETIGVYTEDIRDQYLTRLGFTNLDRSIDQEVMLKKLMSGRIDALVSSPEGIDKLTKAAGYKPKDIRVAFVFLKPQLFIAFSKATPATIVDAWATALEAMKKDGTFERIFRRYYPTTPLPGPAMKPF